MDLLLADSDDEMEGRDENGRISRSVTSFNPVVM